MLTRALAILACVTSLGLSRAQTPPRDAPRLATIGSATLTGRIVADDEMRAPLRRATVTLSRAGLEDIRTTLTDDRGAFVYAELPAGAYTLSAGKAGYVAANYGALQPAMPGTAISLVDRQRFEAQPIALMRGGVIAGRLLDHHGQPSRGTSVLVRSFVTVDGERRRRESSEVGTATNAHGDYRIFGLPPGQYVVYGDTQSSPTERQSLPVEVAWARQPAGQAPPPGKFLSYASTYFPGTADLAGAVPIVLARGEERTGVDFMLQYVPVSRVSGIVTALDGTAIAGARLTRIPRLEDPLFTPTSPVAISNTDGTFAFNAVAPGEYTLLARAPAPAPAPDPNARAGPALPPMNLWGISDITVSGQDVAQVALRMQPGMSISGRVVVQSATSAPVDLTRFGLLLSPSDPVNTAAFAPQTTVKADGTFRFDGIMPGRFRLRQTTGTWSNTWSARSAMLAGRDLLDVPIDLRPGEDVPGVVVTFSDRMAGLTGTLVDAAGQPTPQFYVFMFPVDRAYWTNGSRRVTSARADVDGVYTIGGLPPGEYYVCALTALDRSQQYDASYLEQFVPAASRLTLGDGEVRTQRLRIGG